MLKNVQRQEQELAEMNRPVVLKIIFTLFFYRKEKKRRFHLMRRYPTAGWLTKQNLLTTR